MKTLIFVYDGILPDYCFYSLDLAKKYSNKKIILLITKNNKQIIVIIQPKYEANPLQEIQSQLIIKLVKKYKNVKLLNLSDKINLNDPKISLDQIHNTRLGNELTVQFLLPLIN